jgi:hypothetical protein
MMNPARRRRRPLKLLYSRELPGGGYVTIQAELVDDATYHGWVAVERRSDRNRRDGVVPVIAEAHGASTESLYASLHDIASDNVAVARAIRRWESENAESSSGSA